MADEILARYLGPPLPGVSLLDLSLHVLSVLLCLWSVLGLGFLFISTPVSNLPLLGLQSGQVSLLFLVSCLVQLGHLCQLLLVHSFLLCQPAHVHSLPLGQSPTFLVPGLIPILFVRRCLQCLLPHLLICHQRLLCLLSLGQ